jgi:hypothetical protein
MTGRVHLEGIVALTAEVALDSGSGCHRFRLDRMVFWNSLLQRPMNDLLSFGRLLYRRYAVMGKYPVAFGDWARLSRESLESLPGVGRVSNTSFRRTHYLIRIMKTIEGRIAALHVHGQNYKPLFTHHCLDPDQPLFETPWWAEQCR